MKERPIEFKSRSTRVERLGFEAGVCGKSRPGHGALVPQGGCGYTDTMRRDWGVSPEARWIKGVD